MANDNIDFGVNGLNPRTSIVSFGTFNKQMNKDVFDTSNNGMWTHARNAINNSPSGDYLILGNEPSNKYLVSASYTIIGTIYLYDNIWVIFSTKKTNPNDTTYNNNPSNSGCEIGLFNLNNISNPTVQSYIPIIDDYKLNLCQTNLVYGTSRMNHNGEWLIYWDDGLNPTRYLNLGNPKRWAWGIRNPKMNAWCDNTYMPFEYIWANTQCQPYLPVYPLEVDIDKLMLIPNLKPVKIYGKQDKNSGGTLPNGLYLVSIAYILEGNRVSDYYTSEPIHIHSDNGTSGAIDITISEIEDDNIAEYELIITSFVAEQLTAKKMGVYSTQQRHHNFDTIHPTLENVPLSDLVLLTSKYQYSDITTSVNSYLLRISPHKKFEINYQPLANLIMPKYVIGEASETYYEESGNMVGYMRDEVYSFFIRWIYNDGERTPAYIIPAPPSSANVTFNQTIGSGVGNLLTGNILSDDNNITILGGGNVDTFISTEHYDSNNPYRYDLEDYINNVVYVNNPTFTTSSEYVNLQIAINNYLNTYNDTLTSSTIPVPLHTNICDANIRLVKFPSELDACNIAGMPINIYSNKKIRIMGIYFDNILHPIDNNGNYIQDIQGYEILRSDRNGNKTIIAKGIINNYGKYHKVNNNTNYGAYGNSFSLGQENYLYQNYPLNDLRPNNLLTLFETRFIGPSYIASLGSVPSNISDMIRTLAGSSLSNLKCPDYVVNNDLSLITNILTGFFNLLQFIPSHQLSINACDSNVQHNSFSNQHVSFHSPDTTFKRPYLNVTKLRGYTIDSGEVKTIYTIPDKHPKQKLLKKSTEFFALLTAIGSTTIKLNGKKTIKSSGIVLDSQAVATYSATDIGLAFARLASRIAALAPLIFEGILLSQLEQNNAILALNTVGTTELGIVNTFNNIRDTLGIIGSMFGGITYSAPEILVETTEYNSLPKLLRQALFMPYFLTNLSTSLSSLRQLYMEMSAYRDYALHTVTHCYYDSISPLCRLQLLSDIAKSSYIFNHNTTISDSTYSNINVMNRDRNRHVYLSLKSAIDSSSLSDNSRFRMLDLYDGTCDAAHLSNIKYNISNVGQWLNLCNNPTNKNISSQSSVYYVGLSIDNDNVYGRLYNNKLLLVGTPQLTYGKKILKSEILFGGDTYIGRYAEKNAFFYFNDYPSKMPDGVEYNYLLQRTILYPRYWLSTQLNVVESILEAAPDSMCNQTNFISNLLGTTSNLIPFSASGDPPSNIWHLLQGIGSQFENMGNAISNIYNALSAPSPFSAPLWNSILANIMSYDMDGNVYQLYNITSSCTRSPFIGTMKGIWFYLSHIGIREFWVESEVNLAFRIMGDSKSERYYDYKKNASLQSFVDEDIIRLEDYYKYDWSMSVSKLYSALGSFGVLQRYDYDCETAQILSGPNKNMILYSLPQELENHKDNWHIFLPLNYKLFDDQVINVKQINDSGALLLFRNSAPQYFTGVDTLQSQSNINITIGSGGLFAQPLRSSSNADAMYEYGSMQNKMAIANTPYGIFYIGIDQDKIFNYLGSLQEISNSGIRWWLTKYCQFNILLQFPDYDMIDNTVVGIGALTSFDNQNGLVYFHKIDYKLKDEWFNNREYKFVYNSGTGLFSVYHLDTQGNQTLIDLINVHNELYFKDVSWTLSYDPKIKTFISFHDWHPSITGGSQDTFFSIVGKSIYLHNADCQSYCNYYGKQYPFEVEFETSDNMQVSTMRNVEYVLEVYKYEPNCMDRFHVLDENFNEAIIYNSEQCTGLMRMQIKPKNNPLAELQYPQYNPTSVDILYSKEENKYRINNMLDIIKDRGEFSGNEIPIWITDENGYVKTLNISAIDYNKPVLERKKIRHYKNRIFLRKNYGDKNNMYKYLFIIAYIKKLYSSR